MRCLKPSIKVDAMLLFAEAFIEGAKIIERNLLVLCCVKLPS